jgi:hypothetical protein
MGNLAFFIRTDAFVFEDNWLVADTTGNSIASAHFVYRIYRSLQNRPERVKDIITSFHNQFSLPCTKIGARLYFRTLVRLGPDGLLGGERVWTFSAHPYDAAGE